MIVAWLLKNWRLIVWAVAAAAALWMVGLVLHWRANSHKLEAAEEALAVELECGEASECRKRLARAEEEAEERQREFEKEVRTGYEKSLQVLADRAANKPAPSVRVCRPASPSNLRVSDAAGRADGATAGGDDAVEVGQDIGRELYQAADELDREVVKLRWLQQWNARLATPP